MKKKLFLTLLIVLFLIAPSYAGEFDGGVGILGLPFEGQDINNPDIDGGTIDGTVIGDETPAAGSFTELEADDPTDANGIGDRAFNDSRYLLESLNLSDVEVPATAFTNIKQGATDSATGVVEISTNAEAVAKTETDKCLVPSNIPFVMASPGNIGGTTPGVGDFTQSDIGDGTNYTEIKIDGEINLHGTARVNRHRLVGAASWVKGSTAPTAGISGNFPHLVFADGADDKAHYQLIVPFRMDISEDIIVAVDWYYTGGQNNGKVLWNMRYLSVKAGEDPTPTGINVPQLTAGTHTTGQLVRTTFTTKILASALEPHDILGLTIWRNGDDGTDSLGAGAILLVVHFQFVMNKLGEAR